MEFLGFEAFFFVDKVLRKSRSKSILLNTYSLTDSYIVFTLKMESVPKITIFGLKMMVKIFLKFHHAEVIFFLFILLHRKEEFCGKSQLL
jgi:hypothetical protein